MKIVSAAQKKQLDYMRPYLCRWAGDADRTTDAPTAESDGKPPVREAGRRRAAPHIKTFIRFTDMDMTTIDWALVTSANLSTQAWGAAVNPKKEIRICSWEIGVLIWPDLFADASDGNGGSADMGAAHPHKSAKLVPCFKTDIPSPLPSTGDSPSTVTTLVGFRMPYDLPLQRYTRDDDPWCATSSYSEPDWLGQTWDSWAEK
jgi:tyrosyl-DNA phosphodiesterase-1